MESLANMSSLRIELPKVEDNRVIPIRGASIKCQVHDHFLFCSMILRHTFTFQDLLVFHSKLLHGRLLDDRALRLISAAALRRKYFINDDITAKLFSMRFSLTDVVDEDSLCNGRRCVPLLEQFDLHEKIRGDNLICANPWVCGESNSSSLQPCSGRIVLMLRSSCRFGEALKFSYRYCF